MKNYYCLIVIGNVDGVENTVAKVIEGKFTHKNLGKLFISTFESGFSIWEIENILHGDKRSYFLTKMQGANFTATVQDMDIQNELFADYIAKITNNDDIFNIEIKIDPLDENITPPNMDFKPMDFDDKIKDFIENIRTNFHPFNQKLPKKRRKTQIIPLEPPTLDEILDKINRVGYNKLTKFEKQCLEEYSKK